MHRFDRVLGPDASQSTVFEEVEGLIQSAMDGYHVAILAYGQTGSGKTFTMYGDSPDCSLTDGIIPRATVALARAKIELENCGWEYSIDVSAVEVYDEHVYDLLGNATCSSKNHKASHGPALPIRDQSFLPRNCHSRGNVEHVFSNSECGPCVEGVTIHSIDLAGPNAISDLVQRAAASRTTRATFLNERSSRSHAVFWLRIRGHHRGSAVKTLGSLVLVDLAGSERVSRSGAVDSSASSDQLREACHINKSLSCLVDVFAALARGGPRDESKKVQRSHIP